MVIRLLSYQTVTAYVSCGTQRHSKGKLKWENNSLPKNKERLVSKNWNFGSLHNMKNRPDEKVQEGKDQEKAQSEKDSHSKNQGGTKPN